MIKMHIIIMHKRLKKNAKRPPVSVTNAAKPYREPSNVLMSMPRQRANSVKGRPAKV